MLAAAAASARGSKTRLLAVTVLTSLDAAQLLATGVAQAPLAQVQNLARLAFESGIPGAVCSPQEAASLRGMLPEMHLVVPGIRPAGTPSGDQQRVATPFAAIHAGASQIVVGRPVTQAPQPAVVFREILAEVLSALEA